MLLHTERLTIRLVTADDWRDIQQILRDFHLSPFARFDRPCETDDETMRNRITKWAQVNRQGNEHRFYAVCLDTKVIGYVSFHQRENGYEIGYCFHSAFHGQGYAQESLLALLQLWRGQGVNRILAGTALQNTPSVRLLKAIGFQQIGTEKVSFYQDEKGQPVVFEGGIYEKKLK